jgi:dephospho-CoA kinase
MSTSSDPPSFSAQTSVKRLGLTGSIGAGKSTVARLLRTRGLSVLDADAVARQLSFTPEVLAEVAAQLGPEFVVYEHGLPSALNRPALAALVFADEQQRRVLNGIMHPKVRARMAELEREAAARGEQWVVQDVPLLFEGETWKSMQAVLLVDAPLKLRLARVMARDNLSREAVLARDAAQMPIAHKRKLLEQVSGVLLDNSGDEAALNQQISRALDQLGIQAL